MDIYFQQAAQPMVIYFTGGFNFNSYGVGGGGTVADGNYGDISVNGTGSNWFINTGVVESGNIAARTVTFDKLPEIGAYKFLGRHAGTNGDIQEIGIDGGIEFYGNQLRRSAIIGAISIEAGSGVSVLNTGVVESGNLAARNVTFDKIIEFPAFKLLGRPTGTVGDGQFIGIDSSLDFNNGNLRRAALTGDISASAGSNITSLTTGIITISHFGSGITQAGIDLLTGVNKAAQRNSLELGSAAIANTGDFAAFLHTHPLSGIDQSGATTGQVAQWNGTAWVPATTSIDFQQFTTPGSHTWINPSPTVRRRGVARLVGGGGGGGSGRKGAAGTVRCGGGGGGGAGVNDFEFWTDQLPATVTVTVGDGGAGGASVSAASTNGNNGLPGEISYFDSWRGYFGSAGSGGTNSTGAAGPGGGFVSLIAGIVQNSAAGGAASVTGSTGGHAPNQNQYIPTGGGAGGGITSANSASGGGHGGNCGSLYTWGPSVRGYGGAIGTIGQQGGAPFNGTGFGGGGGGSSTAGNAGAGAEGRGPGAGGGGGGAAVDGVGNSGAGGKGGPGCVSITIY
jgi:hypothetical protein